MKKSRVIPTFFFNDFTNKTMHDIMKLGDIMDEKKKEAAEYGAGSNNLEGNNLSYKEFEEILNTIDKPDESFISALVEYINTHTKNEDKEENNNVEIKK